MNGMLDGLRGWEGPEDRKSQGDESVFGGRWSSCVGRDPKKWEYHGGWMGLVGWKESKKIGRWMELGNGKKTGDGWQGPADGNVINEMELHDLRGSQGLKEGFMSNGLWGQSGEGGRDLKVG
jgi:hypothetical protein